MPCIAVVFDTNIYRRLGASGTTQLSALEQSNGVLPFAHFVTMQELLTRVATPGTNDYRPCRSAIRAMWLHCRGYDGQRYALRTLVSADAQLASMLLGFQTPKAEREARVLNSIISRIADVDLDDDLVGLGGALGRIKALSTHTKRQFVAHFEGVAKTLGGTVQPWAPLASTTVKPADISDLVVSGFGLAKLARSRAVKVGRYAERELSEDDVTRCAKLIEEHFPTALAYLNEIVKVTLVNGQDLNKRSRANAVWDYELSYCCSLTITTNDLPILLVTNDERIHKAAAAGRATSRLMSLAAYRDALSDFSLADRVTGSESD